MDKQQLKYWIPTGLLCLMMIGSGLMYLANQDYVAGEYVKLGFPVWVMYFNAVAKILGGIVLLVQMPYAFLKEFAYAGYLYIGLLALISHLVIGDNMFGGSVVLLILWLLSYSQFRKRAN